MNVNEIITNLNYANKEKIKNLFSDKERLVYFYVYLSVLNLFTLNNNGRIVKSNNEDLNRLLDKYFQVIIAEQRIMDPIGFLCCWEEINAKMMLCDEYKKFCADVLHKSNSFQSEQQKETDFYDFLKELDNSFNADFEVLKSFAYFSKEVRISNAEELKDFISDLAIKMDVQKDVLLTDLYVYAGIIIHKNNLFANDYNKILCNVKEALEC